ncbi:hypothetical protein HPB49_013773 [Dermacentor silvarum]|uniref:Uncharacterized protein n=1 Tax=Dermacentor silvarum TaxID=543639 RepID=A0ACB8CFE2_DERSI|nr:hypothetical protein HPB49_013773 [Dermacentor silvarum]
MISIEKGEQPSTDKDFLHVWEAHDALINSEKRNKLKRKIRSRMNKLNEEIIHNTEHLTREPWHNKCNKLNATESMSPKWNLIRSPIETTHTKTGTFHKLRKVVEIFEQIDQLFNEVRATHIADPGQPQYADYNSAEIEYEALTGPITLAGLLCALEEAKPNKVPGPNHITTTHLRNLTEADHANLLQQMNNVRNSSSCTKECKTTNVIFLPKPGKAQAISYLRPI